MPQFLLTWLVAAVSLVITAKVVPGFNVDTFTAAAIAAIIMGLINAIVRPILVLMTLPLTILTLGLFLLVVNAISISLVAYLTNGFTVTGFFPAVIGSLVLSFVSSLLGKFVGTDNQEA
jgi:putative membrane protein